MWSQATFASPGKGRGQKELRHLQSPGVNFAACALIYSARNVQGPRFAPSMLRSERAEVERMMVKALLSNGLIDGPGPA